MFTDEETEAKELLSRAEIKTMFKDLRKLREVDALEKRAKVANIKTIEEEKQIRQLEEAKKLEEKKQRQEAGQREVILQQSAGEERMAEIQVKEYASEAEKQQIFILESQKLDLENQIKKIAEEQEPPLILEKNSALLEKESLQKKLDGIVKEENQRESEQNFIAQKEQESKIPSEKRALEARRGELEDKREEIEKRRWAIEKALQDLENKIKVIEENYNSLANQENQLRVQISGIDSSLRNIYLGIVKREDEKRKGSAQEQLIKEKEAALKLAAEKEKIQREQWKSPHIKVKDDSLKVPEKFQKKLQEETLADEKMRRQFMQNVENWANQDKK